MSNSSGRKKKAKTNSNKRHSPLSNGGDSILQNSWGNDNTVCHNDAAVLIDEPNESLITEFIHITKSDGQTASNYLQMSNNEINQAVALYFQQSNHNNTPTNYNSVATNTIYGNNSETAELAYFQKHGVRPPIKPKTERLIEATPLSPIPGSKRKRPPAFLVNYKEDDSKEVTGKKAKLRNIFAPPVDITCKGSFTQVLQIALDNKKWLLVNVQDYEFVSLVLNRDFWNDISIREILKDNFIFWQIESATKDAQHFSNFYNVSCYPWIAIIHPLTRKLMRNLSPTLANLVDVKLVPSNISTFNRSLKAFLEETSDDSMVYENNYVDIECSNNTSYDDDEEQFQAAITASLAENGTRAESSTSSYQEPSLFSNNAAPCCSKSLTYFSPLLSFSPGTTDTTSILIRMPDGTRDTRNFAITHPINELFKYLESKGLNLNDYEIVTAYPRTCLNDNLITFEQAKLTPSATVFIQEK